MRGPVSAVTAARTPPALPDTTWHATPAPAVAGALLCARPVRPRAVRPHVGAFLSPDPPFVPRPLSTAGTSLAVAAACLWPTVRLVGAQPTTTQPAATQPAGAAPVTLVGYTPAHAAAEQALEASAVARPDPARAEAHSRALSAEAHVAGTPAQARTRDYVLAQLRAMGLPTETRAYRVFLPHATSVTVSYGGAAADSATLDLREPAVAGDTTSTLAQYPTVNGTSGAGEGVGEVVYANYGLIDDYRVLDSLGVSVRGKVVVARYGRSFRGIKAREAEKRGAAALLIYSDPQDDGYVRGDVYPEGPMRPAAGVQRGSVYNGDGDPSTPGYASAEHAPRLAESKMDIAHIPVVPISYGNARQLLAAVRGAGIPQPWQGGLPFRYHAGPGPVRARVRVADDRATNAYKTIWDTFGVVRGTDLADELVLIGGHRDGWGPGAADNVSGTTSVLEAARAVAEELKAGRRPRRTIVFATWDAEEWGLVGSTEFVEDDTLRLARHAVAYLNQDVAAQGVVFGGGGSPSLRGVLRNIVGQVPDPAGGSVLDAWRRRAAPRPSVTPGVPRADAPTDPVTGDPGGGSDFAGFYNHLGIPIAEWGFGGPAGVYHSQYDSFTWMRRFGDPGFRYHAAAARIGAAMVLRLADADVLPYDYAEYARTLVRALPALDARGATAGAGPTVTAPVAAALGAMERAATAFAAVRDSALAAATPPSARSLAAANEALKRVERTITRPEGLRTRTWFRNLVYAADEDNGYATVVFPSIAEALRDGDGARAGREAADLAGRIGAATGEIEAAGRALGGR
ncbi:folate hydrolase [Gemmatimonadetes bacterium T265]|nr:folate hydrolase [Gemmatimonadetes bacterium T265]